VAVLSKQLSSLQKRYGHLPPANAPRGTPAGDDLLRGAAARLQRGQADGADIDVLLKNLSRTGRNGAEIGSLVLKAATRLPPDPEAWLHAMSDPALDRTVRTQLTHAAVADIRARLAMKSERDAATADLAFLAWTVDATKARDLARTVGAPAVAPWLEERGLKTRCLVRFHSDFLRNADPADLATLGSEAVLAWERAGLIRSLALHERQTCKQDMDRFRKAVVGLLALCERALQRDPAAYRRIRAEIMKLWREVDPTPLRRLKAEAVGLTEAELRKLVRVESSIDLAIYLERLAAWGHGGDRIQFYRQYEAWMHAQGASFEAPEPYNGRLVIYMPDESLMVEFLDAGALRWYPAGAQLQQVERVAKGGSSHQQFKDMCFSPEDHRIAHRSGWERKVLSWVQNCAQRGST